jgi:hypothetical protein
MTFLHVFAKDISTAAVSYESMHVNHVSGLLTLLTDDETFLLF